MTSSRFEDFVGLGTSGDRPVSLDLPSVNAGFRYETDTGTWVWDGSSWIQITDVSIGSSGIDELTGDVTAGPGTGSQAATIANDAITTAKILDGEVTNAKLADMAALTFKMNATGSTDTPQDVTAEDAAAILAPYLPGLGLFVLVISKTADYSISAGETGTTFNTSGASMDVTGSLPPAASGLNFRFVVSAADYHKVEADGTETIVWGGDTSDPGGYIRSNVLGSVLRLEAHGTGGWVAIAESGEWGMDE